MGVYFHRKEPIQQNYFFSKKCKLPYRDSLWSLYPLKLQNYQLLSIYPFFLHPIGLANKYIRLRSCDLGSLTILMCIKPQFLTFKCHDTRHCAMYLKVSLNISQCISMSLNISKCHLMPLNFTQFHSMSIRPV